MTMLYQGKTAALVETEDERSSCVCTSETVCRHSPLNGDVHAQSFPLLPLLLIKRSKNSAPSTGLHYLVHMRIMLEPLGAVICRVCA
eukprot:2656831-Amphidinium_carterae.2